METSTKNELKLRHLDPFQIVGRLERSLWAESGRLSARLNQNFASFQTAKPALVVRSFIAIPHPQPLQ